MHLLYLHQYFVPPDGNGGTRSYEMARRMVRAGHRVTLISGSSFFPEHYRFRSGQNRIEIDGIELRILRVHYSNRMSYARRMIAFLQFVLLSAWEAMRVRDVDLVFASSTPLTIAIPGLLAKIRYRCPMVFEVRDLWPEIPIALGVIRNPLFKKCTRLFERWIYRCSEHIVALSPGMRDGILRTGCSAGKVSVISNCSDVDLFQRRQVPPLDFRKEHPHIPAGQWIVYAGTIGRVNGIDYFAEIAAEMISFSADVQFVIVGDGKCRDSVAARAEELGVLEKNFWLLPPVVKSSLPAVLEAATVASSFVIDVPELWHNSANKFFDALAAGKPIVINHLGWQADFIHQTGAGLVLPPADPRKAAELLSGFLQSGERLAAAAEAATTAACNMFDRDLLAEQLIETLESVHEKG